MGYPLPVEVYEAISGSLEEIEKKAKEQKTVVKAELKDELRSELPTKRDLDVVRYELKGEIKSLDEKIERVRQEFRGEIRELWAYLKFIVVFMIIGFTLFNPQFYRTVEFLAGFD